MLQTSVVGLFCEDVREEKSGQVSIIGVLSDNVKVPNMPVMVPKMGLYIRIHFDPSADPGTVKVKLAMPDSTEMDLEQFEDQVVSDARQKSLRQASPLTGLIVFGVISPLQVKAYGSMRLEVDVGANRYTAGVVNFVPKDYLA